MSQILAELRIPVELKRIAFACATLISDVNAKRVRALVHSFAN